MPKRIPKIVPDHYVIGDFTTATTDGAINNTVCVDQVMWCLRSLINHQGLLLKMHCIATDAN